MRLLILSQLSFWFFLLACFVLMPHFLFAAHEGGASNYGVYTRTSVPYTLAFGLCGVLMVWAAQGLPKETLRRQSLQRLLYTLGALNLLVLESTYMYQVNNWFDDVHIYAGVLLYVSEVVAGIWLWWMYAHAMLETVSLCALLVGFGLLLLTFFGFLHVLLIAEGLTSLGFSALLVRSAMRAADISL